MLLAQPLPHWNLPALHRIGVRMNTKFSALAIGFFVLFATQVAEAKGCLEGAAVGGVAGHVAGKHGKAGAAGGCAVGHHEANKKEKAHAGAAASQPAAN